MTGRWDAADSYSNIHKLLQADDVSAHVTEQVNWEERDAQTFEIPCRNRIALFVRILYWHHHRFCEWYECEVLLDPERNDVVFTCVQSMQHHPIETQSLIFQ